MKQFFKRRWYFFIPLILVAISVFGFITMTLWNYTMPAIFNLPLITFWQALALLVLARILFSGGPKPFHHHRPWAGHFREKWEKMGPEEREKFYQRWDSRCYPGGFRREQAPEQ